MKTPSFVKRNHIYTVDASCDSNKLYLQQADGEPEMIQDIVLPSFSAATDWNVLMDTIKVVPAAGLQDIK
jgi:hypothetical protein